MKSHFKNSSIHHRQEIKAQMREFIDHLRPDVGDLTEPKVQSLSETSAEAFTDLATAFDDCEKRCEVAWRTELMASRTKERTIHASRQ